MKKTANLGNESLLAKGEGLCILDVYRGVI